MYEFLEKHFGKGENGEDKALTFAELQAALSADKELKLVNLSEGGYVAKEKYEAREAELKGVKQQLEDANAQIKSFEGEDIEGIKKKVTDWETKYAADTEALRKQMEAQETAHRRDMYFSGIKFSSNAARIGIMSEFDRQGFQLKDGVFQGADAWVEQMKKDDPASFVLEAPAPEGGNGGEPQPAPAQAPVLPQFASSTSNGSGNDPRQSNAFHFNFQGVRKRPEQQ